MCCMFYQHETDDAGCTQLPITVYSTNKPTVRWLGQMYHTVPLSSLSTHVSSVGMSGRVLRKATSCIWWPVIYKQNNDTEVNQVSPFCPRGTRSVCSFILSVLRMFFFPLVSRQTSNWNYETSLFWARSQNCEKRLLTWSCLFLSPHGTTRLPLDGFSWNLIYV
jgi:hypothetical protein